MACTLLAACSDGGTAIKAPPTSTAPASMAPTTTPSAPAATDKVTLTRVASFTGTGASTGPMALGDGVLAYPFTTAGSRWDQVEAVRLATMRRSVVATSQWSDGLIESVAVGNGWLVYVDQRQKVGVQDQPPTQWRVKAVDLATGRTIVLGTSGNRADPGPPYVSRTGGYVLWTPYGTGAALPTSVWKPGWAAARKLPTPDPAPQGTISIVGNRLVYVVDSSTPVSAAFPTGDCWEAPLTGGKAEQVTTTGLVENCIARGDDLFWSQIDDPASADNFDPSSTWLGSLSTRQAVELTSTTAKASGDASFGAGFVAWSNLSQQAVVRSLAGGGQAVFSDRNSVSGLVADGALVATDSSTGKRPTTFHVRRVRISR
ncbi:MAG TPA: hypothetical protein VFE15_14080 [Marmoricola sp.]|jgi:hypothetical protein|nr:hypothetical protein [Marmoricola sp.]